MPRRPWTVEDEARLLKLHARGLSWLRISRELGRSEASVVGRYLKLNELKTCNASRPEITRVAPSPIGMRADVQSASDNALGPAKRTVVRRPKLRLPCQDPVLRRADAAIADSRQLRERLMDSRWKAAALESRLLDLRESLAGEHRRGGLTVRAAVSTCATIGLLTGDDATKVLRRIADHI